MDYCLLECVLRCFLSLFPFVAAIDAAIKESCRLIGRSDLDFNEVGTLAATMTNIRALYGRRVGVFPGFRAAEDIVDLFPHQVHLVLELGLNTVDIGARATEKSELTH